MPGVVVFLGPSVPEERAKQILAADFRPPAKRGDLYRAAREGAEIICLIDGVFFQDCSVAHKEVLYALDKGAKVIGASSMGALRASELDIYGMEGVGEIYLAYKRGDLVSDDEVALIFDPISFEPLSEPMVNIRYNLELATQKGVIDEQSKNRLLQAAASLYFPQRTYERVISSCEGLIPDESLEGLRRFIREERRDLKREDAEKALFRSGELANEG